MVLPKRTYRIGYLFFKYIMDTSLINDKRVNTGKKLSKVLEKMGIITIEGYFKENTGERDNWYSYDAGMEHSEPKIVKMVIQYLKEEKAK